MSISKGINTTLKFNLFDSNNQVLQLTEEYNVDLILIKSNEDFSIDEKIIPCNLNLEDNTVNATLPASYLNLATTYTFYLKVQKPDKSVYKTHIDSFFVCEG